MSAAPVSQDVESVELAIIGLGRARLTMPELAAMRKEPPPGFAARFSPQLLKHSDEQTLVALAALGQALVDCGLEQEDFDRWAVVSSSRYIGRSAFAAVIDKYRVEGPWGVSVQVIPHRSPHSVSGTISMALHNHGPCIGVGGGPDDEVHALASVAGALRRQQWAGAWIVLSAWSPELAIDRAGRPTSDSQCQAAALAVVPCSAVQPNDAGRTALGYVRCGPMQAGAAVVSPGAIDEVLPGAVGDVLPGAIGAMAGKAISLTDFLVAPSNVGRAWRGPFGGVMIEVDLAAHPRRAADAAASAHEGHAPRRVPAPMSARGRASAPDVLGGRV